MILLNVLSLYSTASSANGLPGTLTLATSNSAMGEPRTTVSNSRINESRDQAAQWQLSVEEWQRYNNLMQGPRGIWSPNLDPVTVLGNHARNASERRRLAELLARLEHDRTVGELAFDRAYREAWNRLYPDTPVIALGLENTPSRVLFFTSTTCPRCDALVPRILSKWPATRVDIFVVGAPSDSDIQSWATQAQIPAQRVFEKSITLNHAGTLLEQLTGTDSHALPMVPSLYGERSGQYQRLSVESLP